MGVGVGDCDGVGEGEGEELGDVVGVGDGVASADLTATPLPQTNLPAFLTHLYL